MRPIRQGSSEARHESRLTRADSLHSEPGGVDVGLSGYCTVVQSACTEYRNSGAFEEGRVVGSVLSGDGRRGRPSGPAQPSRPRDGSDVGAVLAEFLQQHGLTQAQLADRLGVDRTYVSKVLSGRRQIRDVGRLHQVAHAIGVPPERFGLFPDPGETADVTSPGHIVSREVRDDAEAWRDVRKVLNHRRPELTKVASSLYSGAERIAGTPLITSSEWMPVQPVDLEAVRLRPPAIGP